MQQILYDVITKIDKRYLLNLLGIRVEPKQTTFVVVESLNKKFKILNVELIKVPLALDFPEKLKYIRTCVLDILREYDIKRAGIRITEGNSQNLDINRLHIEGVIQEAFASSNIESYFTGRKNSIASKLDIPIKDLTEIINGRMDYNIMNWKSIKNDIGREAALVAAGAL